MRTFTLTLLSHQEPVEVCIFDDNLTLPNLVNELPVFYFFSDLSGNTDGIYREGEIPVVFANESYAIHVSQGIGEIYSANLSYLIMHCQVEEINQLIVR